MGEKLIKVIGLSSGTSLDGIDAAIIEISNDIDLLESNNIDLLESNDIDLLAFETYPYPDNVRIRLLALSQDEKCTISELAFVNSYLGELFADAAVNIAKSAGMLLSDIDLIGSHGQTISHFPVVRQFGGFEIRSTLQIGEPDIIVVRTGITTVADFRIKDMAAGGEGAPLTPYFHYHLMKNRPVCDDRSRIVLNIGGISNVTFLPSGNIDAVRAFDTGPGNMLIDSLVELFTDGKCIIDENGELASKGNVDEKLLAELMEISFIGASPPKSTGRDLFGKELAAQLAGRISENFSKNDLLATVTAFTAESIIYNIELFFAPLDGFEEIIVGGGGVHNKYLMSLLQQRAKNLPVRGFDSIGINADAVEAMAFAFFARETILGQPASLPTVTGAGNSEILGKICPGKDWKDKDYKSL